MDIYVVDNPELGDSDYATVVAQGMTTHLERSNGLLQLERTGPFIPHITFPGPFDVVVTDELRKELENSGLSGLAFQPVLKSRIVQSEWDGSTDSLRHIEERGEVEEPEDNVLDKPHSPGIAEQMGELWEVCIGDHTEVERVPMEESFFGEEIYLLEASWDGIDWFRANGVGYTYVSQRARDWLSKRVGGWVTFREAPVR